jgi:asparaginyl-tRNA synthetase
MQSTDLTTSSTPTPRPSIDQLKADYAGEIVGWLEKITPFKSHAFLVIRDGAGLKHRIQVVCSLALIEDLTVESYVSLTGKCAKLPPKATSFHPFEFHATSLTILGKALPDYHTKCPHTAGPELKIAERHFHLRDPEFALLTKIRAQLLASFRDTFEDMGMTEITPPSFVGVECEGGSTLFHLKHPGDSGQPEMDVYLTQSSQFYLEYALPGVGDCYCIAGSYRAEKSRTRRHLTEFTHAEYECHGIMSLEDHTTKLQTMLTGVLTHLLRRAGDLLAAYSKIRTERDDRDPDEKRTKPIDLVQRLKTLIEMTKSILHLKHQDAIELLKKYQIFKDDGSEYGPRDDIPEAAERKLIDKLGVIVFLTHFPMETKSFYMKADPSDPSRAWGVDVEVPGVGEVVGSGVRESDYLTLIKQMKLQGLKEEDYREYLDQRKYGFGMTSGMGLGVDRFLCWILDLFSIRQAVTFPRYPGCVRP